MSNDLLDQATRGRILSVADTARILGVSPATAYRLIAERELPAIHLRGVISVPAAALETWLAQREQEALEAVRGP